MKRTDPTPRQIIKGYMSRLGYRVTDENVARMMGFGTARTMQNRFRNPDTLRASDMRRMRETLKITGEDLLAIIGVNE